MYEYEFIVKKENGLHIRMVAILIAKLQKAIQNAERLKTTFLRYGDQHVSITNLLAIVSLKIKKDERVSILTDEAFSEEVINELNKVFESQDDFEQKDADRLLIENSITLEEVLANLPNGVVIVNKENLITYVNKEAIRLLDTPIQYILNQPADKVIPHSKLKEILQSGEKELARRQKLRNRTILTNRSPLIYDQSIIGAVALFQDISDVEALNDELSKVNALQEQLNLVLRSVDGLIGLSDKNGRFLFQNPSLSNFVEEKHLRNNVQSIIGEKLWEQLCQEQKPVVTLLKLKDETSYVAKLNPTMIRDEFCGSVLTINPIDNIKLLLEQLDIEKERTKYLELELSKHQLFDKAFESMIGNSATFRDALSVADKVSKSDTTVLVTGESGTGKELVAKAIHYSSPRRGKPFVRVNCAAIPAHLIESELFGHEKGSFTGAIQTRKGKFEVANTGTIFLDEIGDLSLELQSKILRVIQEKEIERIGGYKTIHLDVRIIAATHQNLQEMVQNRTFREDLYFRLNVVPVHLPPLRKRKSDIPLLVDYFRIQFNETLGKNIKGYEQGFIKTMMNYAWPGNIRELRNIIERLMTLTDETLLYLNDLPNYILEKSKPSQEALTLEIISDDQNLSFKTMDEYEQEIYKEVIQHYPSFNQVGKVLGVTHKTAAAKARKYQLEDQLGKKYQKT